MKLVVGLGNPGGKYQATRHNAGFWFVERLAAQSGTVLRKDGKFQALVGRHEASGAWLVLPQTFMNSSGRPVQLMASFFKIQPADILVIHDELDLPPGAARMKQGGGAAGHNGLKDISARLGSHDYWRLRLGIGRPPDRAGTVDFVLHKPGQDERAAIDDAIAQGLDVLPLVLAGDLQGAMLKLHTRKEPAPSNAAAAEAAVEGEARPRRSRREKAAGAAAAGAEQAEAKDTVPARTGAAAAPESGPDPASRSSIIERFGSANNVSQVRKPAAPASTEPAPATLERIGNGESPVRVPAPAVPPTTAPPEEPRAAPAAPQEAVAAKEPPAPDPAAGSGLNSLIRKLLPGGGRGRKK